MRRILSQARGRLFLYMSMACVAALSFASVASAQTETPVSVDYTKLTAPAKDQLSSALVPALTLLGIVGGIYLGVRFFKKTAGVRS